VKATGSRLAAVLPAMGLVLAVAATWRSLPGLGDAAAADAARAAVARGNRLVRDGDLAGALEAYGEGWGGGRGGGSDGVLAYNLGTTSHRAGRLPEALLWYRRAAELRPRDPWVADNLALVRSQLDAPRLPAPGPLARLSAAGRPLAVAATAAAWLSLALLVAGRRWAWRPLPGVARAAWAAVGLVALGLWCTAPLAALAAPRPAVLLADCSGAGGILPAGAEVWVRPAAAGGWALTEPGGTRCPSGSVAPIGRFSASFGAS
jgi:hypothetical protein